ncbi:ABC transporter substrate-binding protein [Nonomuraea sp. NEAU-A123]|uniref:ABC transporter substrate-binding protein n=1 Tax=Nonomuraea sp. NEAU-A123 TaxID=2839649 RepID=UPI001BE4493F|nr:ABC transporter substrate-binding protein [Nonomuraea sp. NEAU-A123]MBT2233995.1 ABC transporter substrate-binding protein [Nonomuraea sp. NEAU-A123]
MLCVPRRGLFVIGAAALLAASGCGGTERPPAAQAGETATAEQGPWEWIDDRGKKISLPRRPQRIVAQSNAAAALWDFGVRPIAVFGPYKLKDGSRDPEVGEVDVDKIEGLGNVWGEFNIERYAALQPDLLVAGMYAPNALWYVPEKSAAAIDQIAPSAGVRMGGKGLIEVIETFGRLAGALGADLDAAPVKAAKARFETAAAELKSIAATKPDLKVMVVTGTPETLYVTYTPDHPDISYFQEQGLKVVSPPKPAKGGFWEVLSWENADKYQADVILVDARSQSMKPAEMAAKPTWTELPAVKAGQVYPWHAAERYSHLGYAKVLEELNSHLKTARTDLVN